MGKAEVGRVIGGKAGGDSPSPPALSGEFFMTTATTTRKPGSSRRPKTFRCMFVIGPDTYLVVPLRPHPEVAGKAYRLLKQTGDKAVYDVRQAVEGFIECDCLGHQRHGH